MRQNAQVQFGSTGVSHENEKNKKDFFEKKQSICFVVHEVRRLDLLKSQHFKVSFLLCIVFFAHFEVTKSSETFKEFHFNNGEGKKNNKLRGRTVVKLFYISLSTVIFALETAAKATGRMESQVAKICLKMNAI